MQAPCIQIKILNRLTQWLGKQSFLDDLASLDPDLYKGLIFLKHDKGNPEELALNFAVSVEGEFLRLCLCLCVSGRSIFVGSSTEFGVTRTVPLVRGGEQIPVTKENRLQYVFLVSNYRLNKQIKKQTDAFFEGLSEIVDPKWLRFVVPILVCKLP